MIGGILNGSGAAWFDAFELDVHEPDGSWTPIALTNPGFEYQPEAMLGWYANDLGATVDENDPFAGAVSVRLMSRSAAKYIKLFDAVPGPSPMPRV